MGRIEQVLHDMTLETLDDDALFFTLLALKIQEDFEKQGIVATIAVDKWGSLSISQTPEELTHFEPVKKYRTGLTMPFGRTGVETIANGYVVTTDSENDKKWLTSYVQKIAKRYDLNYEYRSKIKTQKLTRYNDSDVKKIYVDGWNTIVNFNTN